MYSFVDENPLAGTSYYRLRQTDLDGAFEYFGPLSVFCDERAGGVQVYPNPAGEVVYVSGRLLSPVRICLSDLSGQVLFSQFIEQLSRPVPVSLQQFPAGIYILMIESESAAQHYKVIHL